VTRTEAGGEEKISYTYDGSLVTRLSVSGTLVDNHSYRYGAGELLAGVTHGSKPEVALTWDADRLLVGYGPFTIARNDVGAQTKVSDASGETTYTYDSQGWLAGTVTKAGAVEVYRCAYERDGLGRLTRKTETIGGSGTVTAYAYDRDGRLTSVLRDGDVAETYTYDGNDNRTSRTLGGQPSEAATYDAQDRLQGQGGVTYEFDDDGSLVQRGEYSFTYSERGELLKVMQSNATVASYTYDPLGRRIAKQTDAGTWLYMYGDTSEIQRVTAVKDPAGVLTEYFYDDAGRIYAFQRGSAWYYVACDQVGSPRVVSDALGQVVKTVAYDSWGNVQADSAPEFDMPFGFAGGLADSETGLVHFGYRDYDTASGRWTASDPIFYGGGQPNLYAYCGDDPVNVTDPSGLLIPILDDIVSVYDVLRQWGSLSPGFLAAATWGGAMAPLEAYACVSGVGAAGALGFGAGTVLNSVVTSVQGQSIGDAWADALGY
jgi:RHS repeat-associated protein